MKKISVCTALLTFTFALFLCGCVKTQTLTSFVTELQSDVLEGKSENFNLKAAYGFNLENNERVYMLTVKLIGKESDNAAYTLSFSHGGVTHKSTFSLNPVTDSLTAKIELPNFTDNELIVNVSAASHTESVTLKSVKPDGTAEHAYALDSLLLSQPALIDNYRDANGNFVGEIHQRLIVKNGKAYWYVGLVNSSDDVKALLVDGATLEVLAIRDIF